jgi:large subunit ribosomal protein L3
MKFIIAKKVEMSQRFQEDGTVVPVTLLHAEPCTVTQIRTKEKDGYVAVQIATHEVKKGNKPQGGHTKASGKNFRTTREFRVDDAAGVNVGDLIDVSTFAPGQFVKATGITKGRGFQGVVKRHGFLGGPATHGHKDNLRMPGSIGATAPQRVFKGMRMGGHMGHVQQTTKNLRVVDIDVKTGIIAVRGAVPGHRGTLILLSGGSDKRVEW